jgi:IclR family pca regulon transcriptional regulator
VSRLSDKDSAARRGRSLSGAANAGDFSEALARGLAVLDAFDADHRRLTQADLARELGLSRATVRRAVLTLEHLGYLAAEGRAYELTPKILRLATAYLSSDIVSGVMQPVCDRICARFDDPCSAAVLDGEHAVIIARAIPNRLIELGSGIGYRTPAFVSSLGKVLIAHLDPDERKAYLASIDAETHPIDAVSLDRIRDDGSCYVADDIQMGFHSIAVPLRRWDGRTIAALHLGSSIERIPRERMFGEVLDSLRAAAYELQRQLV